MQNKDNCTMILSRQKKNKTSEFCKFYYLITRNAASLKKRKEKSFYAIYGATDIMT